MSFFIGPICNHKVNGESERIELIVLFHEKVEKEIILSAGGTILAEFDNIPALKVSFDKTGLNELKQNSAIKSAEKELEAKVGGQVLGWGVKSIKSPSAWDLNFSGKGVKVAVLDTGISPHADLSIAGGTSFSGYTSSYHDDNGHGTHVAGIIGAGNNEIGIVGVAPGSQLYAVKVLDKTGTGSLSNIIKGIDWAIKNKMDIINLSLVINGHSEALKYAVDKAEASGILVVGAGGNNGKMDGEGDTISYPAKYQSVIGVAAVDKSNARGVFSATGDGIEFSAPGVSIESTVLNNQYAYYDGTSMAAAFVSGKLALLKEMFPAASSSWIRSKMRESAKDLGAQGKDPLYGFGLVQPIVNAKRIGGKDRFEVAANTSRERWETSNTVFIVNNQAFADALAASPLAYKYNAPILLTTSNKLHFITMEEIKRLKPKEAVLIGGTGSISENIRLELKKLGIKTSRIDGKNRFVVAENIAEMMGTYQKVIIANGLNFPDALAIAPYAAEKGYPILLTRPDKLPENIKALLVKHPVEETIVVGGEASVKPVVYNQLSSPMRIGGKDRYEVAANIKSLYFPAAEHLYIATGTTFSDALTGSVLMAFDKTTILLTKRDELPTSAQKIIEIGNSKSYTILGGEGSVGKGVFPYLVK